jgi:hypothetical protein
MKIQILILMEQKVNQEVTELLILHWIVIVKDLAILAMMIMKVLYRPIQLIFFF